MNYQEAIDYLFTQLPMFSRIGAAAYKVDINNTVQLCEALGNPHTKFKSIHIGGTNGKGSTSHMLAAILQTAGYKTGLYTSPHLKDFRERIKVDGQMCSEDFVVAFTQKIKATAQAIQPSFFEITVVMAFEYFAQQQVDIAVIEVGLGGRLDSTNIITPELSIITNIGWDHMNLLGNTLEQIAFEKAGIIKQNIPVVIGEYLPETKPVFLEQATKVNAPIIFAQEKRFIVDFVYHPHHLDAIVADVQNDDRKTYQLDLQGIYQTKNILTVFEAVHQLNIKDWKITDEIVHKALPHVKKLTGLHGRWEVLQHNPTIVLDVAHNVDGIKQILQQLELLTFNHLHIVTGFVKDKEIDKVLSLFPHYATYYFSKAPIERALDQFELQQRAKEYHLNGNAYDTVKLALQAAKNHAKEHDIILVCGSVFIVGEV